MTLILTTLVGLMQVGPNQCQFDLLHPNGEIDTHTVACELVTDHPLPTNYSGIWTP